MKKVFSIYCSVLLFFSTAGASLTKQYCNDSAIKTCVWLSHNNSIEFGMANLSSNCYRYSNFPGLKMKSYHENICFDLIAECRINKIRLMFTTENHGATSNFILDYLDSISL